MPYTEVLFFRDKDGTAPALEWIMDQDRAVQAKCQAYIERLTHFGYELRRPVADHLEDGIYELRATTKRVHHRLLYFFSGQNNAVIAHGCSKEGSVDPRDIARAKARRKLFESNPALHTYEE